MLKTHQLQMQNIPKFKLLKLLNFDLD